MNRPHNFKGRLLYFPYCIHCGLVLLKNRPTEKAARKLCPYREED